MTDQLDRLASKRARKATLTIRYLNDGLRDALALIDSSDNPNAVCGALADLRQNSRKGWGTCATGFASERGCRRPRTNPRHHHGRTRHHQRLFRSLTGPP
jgi:hypothetical protein